MIQNEEKSIIIAGNGPSLAHIDYRRMPKNAKILRLNNFFFEDKYYLGQNVDYYLTDAGYLEGMYFNLHNLNERRQYNIKDVYITNLNPGLQEEFPLVYDAMKMRGIRLRGGKAGSILEYRLVPMLMCSVKIGEELSAASLTRGLGGPVKRTNICDIGIHVQDALMLLLCVVGLAVQIGLWIRGVS